MVDCTFSCVPKPYYQFLIIMAFDSAYDVYVPCYYVLMSNKTERCYEEAFGLIIKDLDGKFKPDCIGIDFEHAFINTVRKCFPKALIVGCFFHFKQANRKKLQELGFPEEVISHIMSWGVLDLITVLPKSDIKTIDSKGVLFVAMRIESGEGAEPIEVEDGDPIPVQEWFSSAEGKEMMTCFWKYFSK